MPISKRLLTVSGGFFGLAAITVGVSIALASPSTGKRQAQVGLGSRDLSALTSPATAVNGIPAGLTAPSPADRPVAGAVHELGNGKAFGWTRNGDTCWNAGATYGVAACATGVSGLAFDELIHDADALGSGQPAHVSGIAADTVRRIVATLNDGTAFATVPSRNWYDIALPSSVRMDQVVSVTATLSDGSTQTIQTMQ